MINLEHLSIGYTNRCLLENVDASFSSCRLTALLGRNGAGKSTLLRVMAALDKPLAGRVVVDSMPLEEMNPLQRARTISLVTTARVRVANMLCRDVVALGRAPYTNWIGNMRASDRDAVDAALEAVGMADYALRHLSGLSDGERQRIMVARALAQDTPVILLDEPTSFLDLPNRYELCMLLSSLAHDKGKTIVFSTHELDIALQVCDDVALISDNSLIVMPAAEMAAAGHVQRVFSLPTSAFSAF